MLDINVEFRKGILFIRFSGILNKYNYKELNDISRIIKESGINNVVFNFNELSDIDKYGIKSIIKIQSYIKNNNGKCFICNGKNSYLKNKIYESSIMKYGYEIKDELSSFHKIMI